MIINPTLPDGWTSEDRGTELVIRRPGTGYATIDWSLRVCCLGIGITRRIQSARFGGRGWKERLLAEAVRRLQDIP